MVTFSTPPTAARPRSIRAVARSSNCCGVTGWSSQRAEQLPGPAAAMVTVEAVRKAQVKYGRKPLKGSEVRWGLENLEVDAAAIKKLGFTGFMTPVSTTCVNHAGEAQATIHTWDGKKWNVQPGVYHADNSIIKPMIRSSAEKYAAEKKLTKRDCAKEAG